MNRLLYISSALLFLVLNCTAGTDNPGAKGAGFSQGARVDSLVSLNLEPGGPGCAVGIFRDGEIVYEKGYGIANLDYDIPITPSTVFDIASLSKQFTAASVLILAERGSLTLDDDIRKYIPELPDYGKKIEIRHLIHHTSGIRDWVWLLALGGMPFENVLSRHDLHQLIFRQEALAFAPGDKYTYSNSAYNLLALLVERVSGKPLAEFLNDEIFEPLGMENTVVFVDRGMPVKNRAIGYLPDEGDGYRMEHYFNPAILGSSNILSTVEDLHLWDRNFYSNQVGPDNLAEKMRTRGVLNNGDTINYAFGQVVQDYRDVQTVSHEGDWAGFLAFILRFPEQKFTVVCLANTQAFSARRLCYKIADLCLAEWHGMELPEEAEQQAEQRAPVAVEQSILGQYAGTYEAENGRKITVAEENGHLYVRRPGRRRFEVLPSSESEFFQQGENLLINFQRNGQGRVSGLEWRQGSRSTAYINVENRPAPSKPAGQLDEYRGEYYCDALDVTYTVETGQGGLVLKTPIRSRYLMEVTGITGSDQLKPLEKDKYRFTFLEIVFQRDSRGRVDGCTLIHQWAGLRMKFVKI